MDGRVDPLEGSEGRTSTAVSWDGGAHDVIEIRLGSPVRTTSARMCEDSMRPSAPGLTVCILMRQLLRGLFFLAPTDEYAITGRPLQRISHHRQIGQLLQRHFSTGLYHRLPLVKTGHRRWCG